MPQDTYRDRAGLGQSGTSWDSTSSSSGASSDFGRMGEEVSRQGGAALNSLKEGARSLGEEARDRASGYVEGGKQAVTENLEAFAQAIRKASDELSERDQTMAAQLVRQAAGALERATRSIEGTDLEDIIRQGRNFARNHPTAFVGAFMLAGFAVARFARASSRSESGSWDRSGSSWRGDDRGYRGSEEWSSGRGESGSGGAYTGSSYSSGDRSSFGSSTGGSSSYGSSGVGGSSFGSGSAGAGGSSFGSGSAGVGGSSFGSGASGSSGYTGSGGSSFGSGTGSAEVPPGSQGYAGGGMSSDPIQSSSGPSSETDESVSSSSGSRSGTSSSSISTGGNS